MNIVILGAGTVGTSLAEILCANNHDVRLVDQSRDTLDEVSDSLDVQTICGSCCDVTTLFQADILGADLALAVTSDDETNLVGASLSKAMGAKRAIARIFDPYYRDDSTFNYQRHFQIDRILSLEHLTALELAKSIRYTGLFMVENFARGGIEVQEFEIPEDSKVVGQALRSLDLPKQVRVGLLSSGSRSYIPHADDVISAGDHVTLVGTREAIKNVQKQFIRKSPPKRNIVIGGGGEVGLNLALALQADRFNVVLLEADHDRCVELSRRLTHTTVLHTDVTRRSEMEEARVGYADVFVATTGRDEDNIICGVEARALGTPRILSVVRRPDYANVLEKLGIDVAVSPRQVMARQILGMTVGGPVVGASEIAGGQALVYEIEVQPNAKITRSPLKEVKLKQALLAAIVREDHVWVPGAEDVVKPGDTAVLMAHADAMTAAQEFFISPTGA